MIFLSFFFLFRKIIWIWNKKTQLKKKIEKKGVKINFCLETHTSFSRSEVLNTLQTVKMNKLIVFYVCLQVFSALCPKGRVSLALNVQAERGEFEPTSFDRTTWQVDSFDRTPSNHFSSSSLEQKSSTTRSYETKLDQELTYDLDASNEVDTYSPLFLVMCLVYIISTLTAIITNLIVILVFLFNHSPKTDLSIFLVNLAIADFLMSTVCMPFTFAQALLKRWIFGAIMCPIGKRPRCLYFPFFLFKPFSASQVLFKQVLTVSLSIYTMVAIGIDR